MSKFVDLAYARDDEGVYDLVLDNGDLKVTDGLETAIFVSLFSDRRAYLDEVSDPLRRRGWIGDLVSDEPGDRHGSGLWLYEQHRLTDAVASGVRSEASQALTWMIDEGLVTFVDANVVRHPQTRTLAIAITLTALNGGVSTRAFDLADATRTGSLVSL